MDKIEKYKMALQEVKSVVGSYNSWITNLSLLVASLKEHIQPWWVGFYLVDPSQKKLVLGPFAGPLACTEIGFGRGVCGASWKEEKTFVVPNVDEFADHIACSSESRSEIVIPIFWQDKVVAVLDIDSEHLNFFDETDQFYLEAIRDHLQQNLNDFFLKGPFHEAL
ncbi:MAG: GAF domain-containing protein [Bdellovibrionales bacterium]|nr:GAF domain-containing protein [Bdellovibrionales bacterium]